MTDKVKMSIPLLDVEDMKTGRGGGKILKIISVVLLSISIYLLTLAGLTYFLGPPPHDNSNDGNKGIIGDKGIAFAKNIDNITAIDKNIQTKERKTIAELHKELYGELKIITNDTYSRQIILDAIEDVKNRDNINLTNYISSIEVVDMDLETKCGMNNDKLLGCARSGHFISGCSIRSGCNMADSRFEMNDIMEVFDANIYVLRWSRYPTDTTLTFKHVLYHELGHVVYSYRYGPKNDYDNDDLIYRKTSEYYADLFAEKYHSSKTENPFSNINIEMVAK